MRCLKIASILLSLAAAATLSLPGFAAVVTHVGSIEQDLTAPTSLLVAGDGIAALEPFAGQVVAFTSEGVLNCKVDIAGDARALARLEGTTYLFCERSAGQVARVDLATGSQDVFLAEAGDPVDVLVGGGTVRILDAASARVLLCSPTGSLVETVNLAIPGEMTAVWLADLAWDETRSIYYAWDQSHSRVLAFDAEGAFLGQFSSFGSDEGSVTRGGEIVCDQDGWVYVTDRYQGQVVVFDSEWNFVTDIQPATQGGSPLAIPSGLSVDATGFVYVACTEGPAIEVFHLDKSPAPVENPYTVQVSPADGDTLSLGNLRLVAGIQAQASLLDGLVAEFQVFALPDTSQVVAQANDRPLDDYTVAGDLVVGTASWDLPSELAAGQVYGWKARAASGEFQGQWSPLREFTKGSLPPVFRLEQNVPNPFNPRTVISFALTGEGQARLGIFDIRGQLVWKAGLSGFGAGRHEVVWNGTDSAGASVSSGIYFYRLTEGGRTETRKMVLMR
jgi:hypothetical protein